MAFLALGTLISLSFGAHAVSANIAFQDQNDAPEDAESNQVDEISFNDSDTDPEADYIYFSGSSADVEVVDLQPIGPIVTTNAPPTAGFTPRGTGAVDDLVAYPNMQAWLSGAFTPRYQNAHLALNVGANERNEGGVDINIQSSFGATPLPIAGLLDNQSLREMVASENYDVTFSVGYSGFQLGAGVRRGFDPITDGYYGYDVGLGYAGGRFSTRLMVGEYSSRASTLLPALARSDETFYALEFGATYSFSTIVSLTGGYRYLDFSNRFVNAFGTSPTSQVFYLGTRLSF